MNIIKVIGTHKMIAPLWFIMIGLSAPHGADAQPPGCEFFGGLPFYPPYCFTGGSKFIPEQPAFPDPVVDNTGNVYLPYSNHMGMWGNILIADTGNNRIIELNPSRILYPNGEDQDFIGWNTPDSAAITLQIGYSVFTDASADPDAGLWTSQPAPCNYNPDHSVNGPVWATWLMSEAWRVNGGHGGLLLTVVAGFDGCPDNRVRIFYIDYNACYHTTNPMNSTDYGGQGGLPAWNAGDYDFGRANCSRALWGFGNRFPGSGLDELNHPTHAMQLSYDNFFNMQNHNIDSSVAGSEGVFDYSEFVFDGDAATPFIYGCQDETGIGGPTEVNNGGNSFRYGDIMITDQGNNRILRVTFCTQTTIWTYGPKSGPAALNMPTMTQQFMNGNIFIADTGNNRIVEVSSTGSFVSQMLLAGASHPLMFARVEPLSSDGCGCDDGINCGACEDFINYQQYDNTDYEFCDTNYCYVHNDMFDADMNSTLIIANNSLIQYDPQGHVRFTYHGNFGQIVNAARIMAPQFYLITDKGKSTVTILDKIKKGIIWKYSDLSKPSSAVMVGEETGMSRSNFWTSFLRWCVFEDGCFFERT